MSAGGIGAGRGYAFAWGIGPIYDARKGDRAPLGLLAGAI